MTEQEQKQSARNFVKCWTGKGDEKSETQTFWIALLQGVLGVKDAAETRFIRFEKHVKIEGTTKYIDAYIPTSKVLIEQKSSDVKLEKTYRQSDGDELTPYGQAKRYDDNLPWNERAKYIVVCNFVSFLIYDRNKPGEEPVEIRLEDLPSEWDRLSFLVDENYRKLQKEMEISLEAGDIVRELYDHLLPCYHEPSNPSSLKSLNKLCVRLVFCLYAEDARLLGTRTQFHDYLERFEPRDIRRALQDLFRVLNTPPEKRDPYLDEELAAFPYVNGGLFGDEDLEVPQLTAPLKMLLLNRASDGFDWSAISPTIFGAVFESTLNQETRRSGGMHYTSIENIHKVIDPLFLDELRADLEEIRGTAILTTRKRRVREFQEKLSSLVFLDPACGSGNFLTETYLSLRRLENEALRLVNQGQGLLDIGHDTIRVSIHQFYGIEINDFAAAVAKTALWIAESQMFRETQEILHSDYEFLPLKTYANITVGNALRMDWRDVVPCEKLTYIMGNPPFVGARLMSPEQKEDMLALFGEKWPNVGNLDYVCCWYKKSAELMRGTGIRAALVSTNSITQGEQVANLWKPLIAAENIHLDFAYRTFRWDSEASSKAHVHCVVLGFSVAPSRRKPVVFQGDVSHEVAHLNPYLIDAPDVFVESRTKPICPVPEIGIGNKPIDDGNYLFLPEEKEAFVKLEPASEKYFRRWYGSQEFINNTPRWCLGLGECPLEELLAMKHCHQRVQNVRDFRLKSKSEGTRKLADCPTRFHVENMPTENYIVIPKTSSGNRRYVPMGFLSPDVLCSDALHLMPSATLYHFGVLSSVVHNAWMRVVCGRLKSDYRYSKDIVYNNFPWPETTPEQCARIGECARGILDARALYPTLSLAQLYNPDDMPAELRAAHLRNDIAVKTAYGFPKELEDEASMVQELFRRYEKLGG